MTKEQERIAVLRATAESIVDDAEHPDPENPWRNSPGAVNLARAWLAEHRADDEFPIEWDWLSKVATMERDQGYWDVPPSGDVWWEIGPISFDCDPYQADPGEPVETVAVNWQVDGDRLPDMLVPKTRGQLRQLCRLLGVQLKEPG